MKRLTPQPKTWRQKLVAYLVVASSHAGRVVTLDTPGHPAPVATIANWADNKMYKIGQSIRFRMSQGSMVSGKISRVDTSTREPQYHVIIHQSGKHTIAAWVWHRDIDIQLLLPTQGCELSHKEKK